MTKQLTQEAIKVMQAWVNGATIQFAPRETEGWGDCNDSDVSWTWSAFQYRIKPIPMEIEVWVKNGGPVAFACPGDGYADGILTKKLFREVL